MESQNAPEASGPSQTQIPNISPAPMVEAVESQNAPDASGSNQTQNQNQDITAPTDVTANIEPIVNSLDQSIFDNYYKDSKKAIMDHLKATNQEAYPVVLLTSKDHPNGTNKKPERRDYKGDNKKGIHWNNLESQLSQWGAHYLEETRKMIASSEARSNKNTARMLFATNAQVEKLESVIVRSMSQADIHHKVAFELLEIIKNISSSNNEKCDNGFRNLLPTDGAALAVNIEGINKHFDSELSGLEARMGMDRREENSKNKNEIKNTIRNNLRGAQRRNTLNSQSGFLCPSTSESQPGSRDPSPNGPRSLSQEVPSTESNGPVFHSQPATKTTKVAHVDETTREVTFSWAELAGSKSNNNRPKNGNGNRSSNNRNNNKNSGSSGNTTTHSNTKNPDHELRDSEKAEKAATNKANAEERASREFIVMRLTSTGRLDKNGEFKNFEKVVQEVGTNSLGSQGYDFFKEELQEIQLQRIFKYGGNEYNGIYPLKVECPTKAVRDKFMECAAIGGFLDKRSQVELGWYQKSKMSEDDFKKNAPRFYLTESTTFAQRKLNREKAKKKEELKNSATHQNYLAWKNLDQLSKYRYTTEEFDALYDELYPSMEGNSASNNASGSALATNITQEQIATNAAEAANQIAANAAKAANATNTTTEAKQTPLSGTPQPPMPQTNNNNVVVINTDDNSNSTKDDDDDLMDMDTPGTIPQNSVDDLIKLAATSATNDNVFMIPKHMNTNQLNLTQAPSIHDPLKFKSSWGIEVQKANTPPGSPISKKSHPPGVQSSPPPTISGQTRSARDSAEINKILSEITNLNVDILALMKDNKKDEAQSLALKQEILRVNLGKKYNYKSPPHEHFIKEISIQVPTTHNEGPKRQRRDAGVRTDANKRSWCQDAKSPDLKPKSSYNSREAKLTPSSPASEDDKLNKSSSSINHTKEGQSA